MTVLSNKVTSTSKKAEIENAGLILSLLLPLFFYSLTAVSLNYLYYTPEDSSYIDINTINFNVDINNVNSGLGFLSILLMVFGNFIFVLSFLLSNFPKIQTLVRKACGLILVSSAVLYSIPLAQVIHTTHKNCGSGNNDDTTTIITTTSTIPPCYFNIYYGSLGVLIPFRLLMVSMSMLTNEYKISQFLYLNAIDLTVCSGGLITFIVFWSNSDLYNSNSRKDKEAYYLLLHGFILVAWVAYGGLFVAIAYCLGFVPNQKLMKFGYIACMSIITGAAFVLSGSFYSSVLNVFNNTNFYYGITFSFLTFGVLYFGEAVRYAVSLGIVVYKAIKNHPSSNYNNNYNNGNGDDMGLDISDVEPIEFDSRLIMVNNNNNNVYGFSDDDNTMANNNSTRYTKLSAVV